MGGLTVQVVVAGPPRSGATSLAAVLGERLPGHRVVEAGAHCDDGVAADVVVFVVSAAAPITCSDASLLDAAARRTDAVIATVAKIDVHRTWREVLRTNRSALSGHAARYRRTPWMGVAAAPDIGEPEVDALVSEIRTALSSADLARRNALRARCSRLAARIAESERDEHGRSSVRRRQLARAESAQARIHLAGRARAMCAALRVEFQQASTHRPEAFRLEVERRVTQLCAELDGEMTCRLAALGDCDRSASPKLETVLVLPPIRRPGPENRLSILVGLGFGLGSAATLDRLITEFAPAWNTGAAPGCLAGGVVIGAWAVHMRRAIAVRSALDRWVIEVAAALRTTFEERIAARFLAVESALRVGSADLGDDHAAVTGTRGNVLIRELAGIRRQLDEPA